MADKDSLITYETLYELLRIEQNHADIQKLDPTFYSSVVKYLGEKRKILSSQEGKESIFTSENVVKTRKQVENIQKILKELHEKRENKIVQSALLVARTLGKLQEIEGLLPEEKEFYESLVSFFAEFRTGVLERLLAAQTPQLVLGPKTIKSQEKGQEQKLVKFLHPVPQFVGEDLQVYGPFDLDDVASLPGRVSEVLLKNKRAEEL
ncbi:DNA replication complex GINS family protein [Candidatus Woesearchaeota archaeon]|nr:DNA replication complex GINS family protein [Candidatus Woesearchaeota archaeon]